MGKLLRGMRVEWLTFDNTKFTAIGKDLDDYATDLNPDVETKKNILGETSVEHKGFTPSSSVDYQARSEDAIYEHLQKIVDELAVDEATIKATLIKATLDKEYKDSNESNVLTGKGYSVPVIVVPTTDGGGTGGYTISFECHECGARTQGTVEVKNKVPTFTPGTGTTEPEGGETT